MKRYFSFLIFGIFYFYPLISQETKNNTITCSIQSGFAKQTTNDQLLNYFNYTGQAGLPVKVSLNYLTPKYILSFSAFYHKLTLNPTNNKSLYYEFNYIKNKNWEVNLDYFRRFLLNSNKIGYYLGITSNLYSITQIESYKNVLYDTQVTRNSYDFSLINLSPSLMVNLSLKKQYIQFKASYTIINLGARPDDNYVKQVGYKSNMHWKLYSLNNYINYHFDFLYNFRLPRNFGIFLEYSILYHSHRSIDNYQYLQKSLLFGINKSF